MHILILYCPFSYLIGTRQVCLVMDNREKQKERMATLATSHGLPILMRDLPVGDYIFVLLPPGVTTHTYSAQAHQHLEQVSDAHVC